MWYVFGVGFLVMTWCLLVAWIGKTAMARGRSAAVWCLIGGAFGGLGITAGFMLSNRLLEVGGDELNLMAAVAALFTPVVALVVPMVVVRTVLQREPIHGGRRSAWKVSVMGKGNGTISVDGNAIKLELEGAARTLDITTVEADGECVRITLADEELVAMPMGKPETPAGRKQQSLLLAKQLRQAKSLH